MRAGPSYDLPCETRAGDGLPQGGDWYVRHRTDAGKRVCNYEHPGYDPETMVKGQSTTAVE